eukprot:TRINITY_DN859_c0_g1_i1.p1 TRINITY_DN859_c0_g1~~TRINITY_DN859_c0_g1_i1.p1  ORF type:complete len:757 (-),score=173.55 TRINITY_DN859_c0_g1_i1:94-2316(-)
MPRALPCSIFLFVHLCAREAAASAVSDADAFGTFAANAISLSEMLKDASEIPDEISKDVAKSSAVTDDGTKASSEGESALAATAEGKKATAEGEIALAASGEVKKAADEEDDIDAISKGVNRAASKVDDKSLRVDKAVKQVQNTLEFVREKVKSVGHTSSKPSSLKKVESRVSRVKRKAGAIMKKALHLEKVTKGGRVLRTSLKSQARHVLKMIKKAKREAKAAKRMRKGKAILRRRGKYAMEHAEPSKIAGRARRVTRRALRLMKVSKKLIQKAREIEENGHGPAAKQRARRLLARAMKVEREGTRMQAAVAEGFIRLTKLASKRGVKGLKGPIPSLAKLALTGGDGKSKHSQACSGGCKLARKKASACLRKFGKGRKGSACLRKFGKGRKGKGSSGGARNPYLAKLPLRVTHRIRALLLKVKPFKAKAALLMAKAAHMGMLSKSNFTAAKTSEQSKKSFHEAVKSFKLARSAKRQREKAVDLENRATRLLHLFETKVKGVTDSFGSLESQVQNFQSHAHAAKDLTMHVTVAKANAAKAKFRAIKARAQAKCVLTSAEEAVAKKQVRNAAKVLNPCKKKKKGPGKGKLQRCKLKKKAACEVGKAEAASAKAKAVMKETKQLVSNARFAVAHALKEKKRVSHEAVIYEITLDFLIHAVKRAVEPGSPRVKGVAQPFIVQLMRSLDTVQRLRKELKVPNSIVSKEAKAEKYRFGRKGKGLGKKGLASLKKKLAKCRKANKG